MTRQEAIDATLKVLTSHSTTAEQILALGRLYDLGHANGIIAGTQHTVAAIDMVQNALSRPRAPA
jgi:hypothetical protein